MGICLERVRGLDLSPALHHFDKQWEGFIALRCSKYLTSLDLIRIANSNISISLDLLIKYPPKYDVGSLVLDVVTCRDALQVVKFLMLFPNFASLTLRFISLVILDLPSRIPAATFRLKHLFLHDLDCKLDYEHDGTVVVGELLTKTGALRSLIHLEWPNMGAANPLRFIDGLYDSSIETLDCNLDMTWIGSAFLYLFDCACRLIFWTVDLSRFKSLKVLNVWSESLRLKDQLQGIETMLYDFLNTNTLETSLISHNNYHFTQPLRTVNYAFRALSEIQAILMRPPFRTVRAVHFKYYLRVHLRRLVDPRTPEAYVSLRMCSGAGAGTSSGSQYNKRFLKGNPDSPLGRAADRLSQTIEKGLKKLMTREGITVDLQLWTSTPASQCLEHDHDDFF